MAAQNVTLAVSATAKARFVLEGSLGLHHQPTTPVLVFQLVGRPKSPIELATSDSLPLNILYGDVEPQTAVSP